MYFTTRTWENENRLKWKRKLNNSRPRSEKTYRWLLCDAVHARNMMKNHTHTHPYSHSKEREQERCDNTTFSTHWTVNMSQTELSTVIAMYRSCHLLDIRFVFICLFHVCRSVIQWCLSSMLWVAVLPKSYLEIILWSIYSNAHIITQRICFSDETKNIQNSYLNWWIFHSISIDLQLIPIFVCVIFCIYIFNSFNNCVSSLIKCRSHFSFHHWICIHHMTSLYILYIISEICMQTIQCTD